VSAGAEEPASGAGRTSADSASRRRVIVTGASGLVGRYLLPLLRDRGFAVQAVSRRPARWAGPAGTALWMTLDLGGPSARTPRGNPFGPADSLVHAAPIWLLPAWLPAAAEAGVSRLVAVSSTSRFTKQGSSSPRERETARRLAEGEESVERACRERRIRWTILRPTLVYGGGRDENVSAIARFVRRFGFFPIAGEGRGKRQPVHAADLARAALAVLDSPNAFDRAYETPGGETLSYAEMVCRIARGLGRAPRLVHLPLPLLRGALAVASRLPGLGHAAPDMANRMDEDLVFDGTAAGRDFGYNPRPFRFPDEPDDSTDVAATPGPGRRLY
jgi:nucleoside-diphosphate-sugar epimerase